MNLPSPGLRLLLFSAGTTHLNEHLAFECRQGQVTDLDGHLTINGASTVHLRCIYGASPMWIGIHMGDAP